MLSDLSVISYGAAAAVYAILAVLLGTHHIRRNVDRALLLASLVTLVRASSLVTQSVWGAPGFFARYLLELLRYTAWIFLLFAMLRNTLRQGYLSGQIKKFLGVGAIGLLVTLITLGSLEFIFGVALLGGKTKVIGQLALSLLGLSLVEQIWRNAPVFGRASMKYLCIGIATIFVFDFLMYADALLFSEISNAFWNARGLVNAALVPLFAVNVINARRQPVSFHLSRSAAFHAGTFILAGIYLVILSITGYYVRTLGGEWGQSLQVILSAVALVFLTTLIASRRVRARLMVRISQNFFDYKYDYRDEWLKMTKELSDLSQDPPLAQRVIRILANLVESNAGAIWLRSDTGTYTLKDTSNLAVPKYTVIDEDAELVSFFKSKEWIINLDEYQADPLAYDLLEIPEAIAKTPDTWLIIPLFLDNELYGIAVTGRPLARIELNWENFDLIKVVARQTCNLLAQADAQNRLSRAMQFEAVSKASAFMAHDLKTVIAQLSLLVNNAQTHKHNPAFVDDMINTTEHAVRKMTNLLEHIRKPPKEAGTTPLNLNNLVANLLEQYENQRPVPRQEGEAPPITVNADEEQLKSVLGHLIQNALDATPPDGEVSLSLKKAKDHAVLFIQDSGSGMTDDFLNNRLFKPFESTKGLTGMGIGAYQAREYIQQLGGTIDATSEPGTGSCFSIRIPVAEKQEHDQRPSTDRPAPIEM